MKVLIACEFSGRVREAFRTKGHEAISCDLLRSEIPGPHIQDDVRTVLNDGWDMMIAFPPCTHLCSSGARWFKDKAKPQAEALEFVRTLLDAPIEKIALENPIGVISTHIRGPDQIVQPWQFGDSYQKSTCLWLKNLSKLKPTNIVDKGEIKTLSSGKKIPAWYNIPPGPSRVRIRSLTSLGISRAMAEQWGAL